MAIFLAGCRCEDPPSRAEVLLLASMEPGAPQLTAFQEKEFRTSLSRLSDSELGQLFQKLDEGSLRNRESAESNAWRKAAYLIADEILERDLDYEPMAVLLWSNGAHDNRNWIFLRRVGEKYPERGWQFLKKCSLKLKSSDLGWDNVGYNVPVPFFQAVQEHHPKLALKYLEAILVYDSPDYIAFLDLRAHAVAAYFSACSSSDEVISLLEWTMGKGISQYWVSSFDSSVYFIGPMEYLGTFARGIFVLARMDPLIAQEWIIEHLDELPATWGVAFVMGAVEYAPEVQEGNPRYENRYEEAMEFVARQTAPESEVFTKLIGGSFSPEPEFRARLLEIQKEADRR